MILAILAFIWGYRKGRDSGRSGPLWSAICGFTFLGIQVIFSLAAGLLLGIGAGLYGWDVKIYDQYSILISLLSLIPAGLALWLIFKYLDRIPDESLNSMPPPPPNFRGE